jgi:hypothetical protein
MEVKGQRLFDSSDSGLAVSVDSACLSYDSDENGVFRDIGGVNEMLTMLKQEFASITQSVSDGSPVACAITVVKPEHIDSDMIHGKFTRLRVGNVQWHGDEPSLHIRCYVGGRVTDLLYHYR